MKNCGHRFHALVTSRDFVDGVLVKIISPKNNPPTIVQDKVLALIQVRTAELNAQSLHSRAFVFSPVFMTIYNFQRECTVYVELCTKGK